MKRISTIATVLLTVFSAKAQFNNAGYLYNQNFLNPALPVLNQNTSITSAFGHSFFKYSSPLSGSNPYSLDLNVSHNFNKNNAADLIVSHNKIGTQNTSSFMGSYSHAWTLSENTHLSVGFRAGLGTYKWNPQYLNTSLGETNSQYGIFGAGLHLDTKRFFVGVSLPQIVTPVEIQVSSQTAKVKIVPTYFNALVGAKLNLGSKTKLIPALLINTAKNYNWGLNGNLTLNYNDKINIFSSTAIVSNRVDYGFEQPLYFAKNSVILGGSIRFFKKIDIGYTRQIINNNLIANINPTQKNQFFLRFIQPTK